MPPPISAGLVVFRRPTPGQYELFLVHPGGPFWAKKDEHAWSIPKGEVEPDEDPAETAKREFAEETGLETPPGEWLDLGTIRQSRKIVHAWAVEGDLDPAELNPGTLEIDWPPRSGKKLTIPEVDRAEWFDTDIARTKLHKGQILLVDRLLEALG